MEISKFNDSMHELICRDRYLLDSTQSGMWVRELYRDLPEAEVIKEWWVEHAPTDMAEMFLMEIGDGERVIAIPLSTAAEARWKAAAASIWSTIMQKATELRQL